MRRHIAQEAPKGEMGQVRCDLNCSHRCLTVAHSHSRWYAAAEVLGGRDVLVALEDILKQLRGARLHPLGPT